MFIQYRYQQNDDLVLNCITTFPYDNVWACLDMHLHWNAQRKTRQVWLRSVRVGPRKRATWSVPESFWLVLKARRFSKWRKSWASRSQRSASGGSATLCGA